MKKLVIVMVITLIMSLTMPFLSSAAVIDKSEFMDRVDETIRKMKESDVYKSMPSSFSYYMVLVQEQPTYWNVGIYCFDTPVLANSGRYYRYVVMSSIGPNLNIINNATYTSLTLKWNNQYNCADFSLSGVGMGFVYFITDRSTAKFSNHSSLFPGKDWEARVGEPLPDISALENALTQADVISNTGYTSYTWSRFTTARANGHNLLDSGTYTQAQVDAAANELVSAMNGLTPLPNSNNLENELATIRGITDIGYTEDSWDRFVRERQNAEDLLNGQNYTQQQVDEALAGLKNAREGLTLAAVTPPEPPDIPPIVSPTVPIYHLTPDMEGYMDITTGIKPKHLIPAKEAIFENIDISRKYGLFVYIIALLPSIGVFIFVRFLRVSLNDDMAPRTVGPPNWPMVSLNGRNQKALGSGSNSMTKR